MADINSKRGVNVTSPFKLFSESPLDSRLVVEDISERDSIIKNNAAYEGLIVYVRSEDKFYSCEKTDDGNFIFVEKIAQKENLKTIEEKTPDITTNLLESNIDSYWANNCRTDPKLDIITSLMRGDTTSDVISTYGISGTSSVTNGYICSPIIRLDFNKYDKYNIWLNNNSYSRMMRHIIIRNYNTEKIFVSYASSDIVSVITAAMSTVAPSYDGSSSNYTYLQPLELTLESIKELSEYCKNDENRKDESIISTVSDTDKIFYLCFTANVANIEYIHETKASWNFTALKKGEIKSHIEFNIPGLAISDDENRFNNKTIDNIIYSLSDFDNSLGVANYKSEIKNYPEEYIDTGLKNSECWYDKWTNAITNGSSFKTWLSNGEMKSDVEGVTFYKPSFSGLSYTSAYTSFPILKIDFSKVKSVVLRLDNSNNSSYIRHIAIYDSSFNTIVCLNDTTVINGALRYIGNYADDLPGNTIVKNGIEFTKENIKKIYEYVSETDSFTYNDSENIFYVYITTRLPSTNNVSSEENLQTAINTYNLYVKNEARTENVTSYELPALNISNSSNYYKNTNLNDVLDEIGLFTNVAAPENVKIETNTEIINLYEEDASSENKYISQGRYPTYTEYTGYACTKLIEINTSVVYTHSYIRHIAIYDINLNCLKRDQYLNAGVFDTSYWPAGAKYICISNTGENRNGTFSYSKITSVKTFELPNLRLVETNGGGSGSLSQSINLKNVDRVGVIGDSYTESHYTLKDKSWVSKVSLFSDFNFENFAISGDTFRGQLNKIRTGYNRYFSSDNTGKYSWESAHPSYAMLVCRTNDVKYMDESQYMYDLMAIAETTRNMGAIPIFTTEYHSNSNDVLLSYYQYLSEKYGGYYIDLYTQLRDTRGNDYAPFWGGSHPGTRTNELMAHECTEFFLHEMPRPYQSIKIFRVRQEPESLDDLIFGDIFERAEKFKEISVSHSALTEPKYYDNCTSKANSAVQSEYLKLMNGVNINFNKYALIDVIFPATSNSISKIELKTNELSNVDCYILDPLAEPYPSPLFYRRFDIPEILENGVDVAVGNTYTSSLHDTTVFTVKEILFDQVESDSGFVSGTILICSGNRTNTATDGGTLTKTKGTGENTLNFYYSATALSSDYPSGKQPIGHWKKLETFGIINESDIKRCMQVDKISFLLVSANSFNLSSLEINYVGTPSKSKDSIARNRHISYGNFKKVLDVENTTEPMPEAITPADNCRPGVSKNNNVYMLSPGESFTYKITNLNTTFEFMPATYKVRVIARYFPDIFDAETGTFGEGTSPISLNSFDYVKLTMRVRYASSSTDKYFDFTKYVSLHWCHIDFDLMSSPGSNTVYLEFFVEDKPIQFSSVEAFIQNY